MNGMYLSKAQRDYLDSDRIKAQREQRIFEQQATPAAAANMATFETLYPAAPVEIGLSLVAADIPATDPIVQDIVNLDQTQRVTNGPLSTPGGGVWDGIARTLDEFVYDPIKGAASWGMMGLMAVYEVGPGGSLIRSAEQARQDPDTSFGQAWQEQQPFLTDAGGQAFGGLNRTWETIKSAWQESTTKDEEQQAMMEAGDMQFTSNTGGGWFVNSDVAPDVKEAVEMATANLHRSLDGQNLTPNQRYRAELEASPQIWNEAVAGATAYQGGLGAPMSQQGYANRESVMFQVPNFTGKEDRFTPWSPGRIAAATVFEPGTGAFSVASGLGDIAAQIKLDPMNKIGKLWALQGEWGRAIWAGTTETNNNVNRVFGEGFQMANRNYVATRRPVREIARTGAKFGDETGMGMEGVVAHGGRPGVATEGLKEGGLTHSIDRAAAYSELPRYQGDTPQVHLFDREQFPPQVNKTLEAGDIERYISENPELAKYGEEFTETFNKLKPTQDAWVEAIDEWEIALRALDDAPNDPGLNAAMVAAREKMDKASEAAKKATSEAKKGWDQEKSFAYDLVAYKDEAQVIDPHRPMPFASMSPDEARKMVAEGGLPYVPDESIDMMENFKLRTENAPRDPDAWKTGQTPLGPFDPPEFYADASRAAARTFEPAIPVLKDDAIKADFIGPRAQEPLKRAPGKRKAPKMFGRTEKQFLNDYEDFYLPEGTVDEMGTMADKTNRVGQQPALRVVTKSKEAGTNQKVRVFGSTIDLSGTSLEKVPAKVRKVLQGTGLWDHKIGFRGSGSNKNWHHSLANAMREEGVGRVKLPDGGWLVVDDFIGGSKADNMGSRIFYADGAKPIHPSALPSSAGVTPDDINKVIDNIRDIAKHAINPDGTIDGTKLSREAIEQLKKDNPELFAKLDEAIANGKTPTQAVPGNRPTLDPNQGFELRGKHKDTLVKDLFEMAKGDGGAGRVDRFLRKLEKKGVPIPLHVRQGIIDATNPEEIRGILAAWIGTGPGKVTLPGGTGYGRMRGMLGVIDSVTGSALAGRSMRGVGPVGRMFEQSWAQRQLAMMLPSEGVNMVDDPAAAYTLMNDMLINYGVARGGDNIEDIFARLRNLDVGDRREAYSIMRDYEAVLFGHLVETTDVPEAYIKAVTQFIDDNGVMHIYNAERIGQTALGGAVGDMTRLSGEATHMPGMSLTTEMWNGAMHIPSPVEVKRVTAYQNKVGDIANFITSKRVKLNEDLKWEKVGRKDFKEQAAKDAKRLSARQAKADKDKPLDVLIKEMKESTGRVEIQDRAGYYLARSAMNKIWKPLVLLRGAWTIRILMDDQMRVAAEGMSMFNHPIRMISYAMSQPKAWKEAFTKGFVDINGTRVTLKNIDTVHHGLMYQRAMMAVPDGVVGRGAYGSRYARVIKRGKPGYEEGLTSRLSQFGGDGLGRRLAASNAENTDTSIANSVQWLAGDFGDATVMGKTGRQQLQDIIALKADDPELVAKLEAAASGGDRQILEWLVTEVNAEMHHTAGGLVILRKDGLYLRYDESLQDITEEVIAKYNLPRPDPGAARAHPIVLEKGNDDIMEVLGTGGWKDPDAVNLPKGDKGKSFNLTARNNTLTDPGYKKFRRMVTDKVQESADSPEATRFLTQSYGPDLDSFGGADAVKDSANRAIGFFYEWMMTKPSDRLSRSPLFAARYWRSVGERMPFLDDATRAVVRAKAIKAGKLAELDTAYKRTAKMIGKTDAGRVNGTLTGKPSEIFDAIDEYAKAAGLAEVESTLFNLTQKRNISDSLNLIFPFVEAWGEFATRWSRLMVYGDRNIKNANRLQQGVNSLRESDPFSPTGDQGFFHENEFGQEVFSYPAFITQGQIKLWNMLAAVTPLTGISPEVADSIKATGSVESLNFASGILPGFGPIFQMASKAALSDDPRWDGIKEIISPFGTGGGAVSQFAPGWIKRMVSATGGSEDPQLNALWMSTVQDVVRAKIDNGDFNGVTDQSQIQSMVAEAESEAQNLLMVRAANTFWAPSSPSYKFTKEDATGKVHTYSELGQEYRKILYDEAGGNETTAFGIFFDRYGSLPESFTAAKTYTVKPGPVTTEGYRFQRDNPEFFDSYPSTAMFLMPDVDLETHEFNYERYLERLRLSESEQWTGEQLVSLRDDLLGGMEWDHAMQTIQPYKDGGDTETYNSEMARLRNEIQERHPYWGQRGAPGQRIGVSNDAKMVEIEAWTRDPNLRGVPIVEAARQYLDARNDVLATLETEYGLKTLDGSFKKHAVQARTYLRGISDGLMGRYPEFAYLFDRIYSREVSVEHDGYSNENVDFYGEDFFEATMGISPDTLPKFENKYLGANV